MMSKNMLFFLLLTILKESASQGLEEAKSKSMPFPNDRIPSCKKVNYSEGRLYDMIMNKNQYRLRPRLNQSETVDIEVVLTLTAISEFVIKIFSLINRSLDFLILTEFVLNLTCKKI